MGTVPFLSRDAGNRLDLQHHVGMGQRGDLHERARGPRTEMFAPRIWKLITLFYVSGIHDDLHKMIEARSRLFEDVGDIGEALLELPAQVELEITDTIAQPKGATATNQLKEATVETGARVRVPPFIEVGQAVKINPENGEYMGKA